MNQETKLLIITFIFIMGVIISVPLFIIWSHQKQVESGQMEYCEDFDSWDIEFECCKDCHDLDMKHLKNELIRYGLFAGKEMNCYCSKNKEPKQIY